MGQFQMRRCSPLVVSTSHRRRQSQVRVSFSRVSLLMLGCAILIACSAVSQAATYHLNIVSEISSFRYQGSVATQLGEVIPLTEQVANSTKMQILGTVDVTVENGEISWAADITGVGATNAKVLPSLPGGNFFEGAPADLSSQAYDAANNVYLYHALRDFAGEMHGITVPIDPQGDFEVFGAGIGKFDLSQEVIVVRQNPFVGSGAPDFSSRVLGNVSTKSGSFTIAKNFAVLELPVELSWNLKIPTLFSYQGGTLKGGIYAIAPVPEASGISMAMSAVVPLSAWLALRLRKTSRLRLAESRQN